ncbi:MAG: hypothetical protein AB1489_20485 [Acidobacteriota bacterium]
MNSIRCPQCSLINGVTDSRCQRCGTPLTMSGQLQQAAQNRQETAQTQQQPSPPQWQQPYPPQPSPQQFITQPAMQPTLQPIQTGLPNFVCPYCRSQALLVRNRISTAGWIVFVLLIFFCLPLCWIGLLMKEEYRTCVGCGVKLN